MFKNILKGLSSYKDSLKLINQLKLWKYFLVPMGISFLFGVAVFFTAYGLSDNLGRFFAKAWIWEWGNETVTEIATWLGVLVILVLGFILYKHVVMALSAPFMSPVSERVEQHYYPQARNHIQHRDTTNMEQLWRGVRINLRNIAYELLITLPLLLLSFIPVIGIVFTITAFIVQAYYAGFGNIDYTLERHFKYRDSINFVKRNRGIAIGIGIVFMGMLFIPVLGVILVLPFSVTAASRATLEEMIKEENLSLSDSQKPQINAS
ncbi:CysZ protein [Nonlabens dokdonensis]|uniref:Coproporphyrinogen III oxidase n=2 Tax=Nonlabens dokdonensis TaxID=328515 RepID=L7WAA7_NONDD|nr:EI24 domain-containing protein [Nonlabens dokdonensis]AGC76781.1 coproporphyrinogen III oxidase [Nonlabens dokdonensis DSW-6]PZX44426.1 CysZ protein [Nonlabens dokdonensis]